jgi:hypothetical protein
MLEQLRKRRADLIATKMIHVLENQRYLLGDASHDPEFPSFADESDLAYYHRLQGHIEECTYLMAMCMVKKATTGTTDLRKEVMDWST